MRFEFATAGRIVFGPATIKEAAPIAAEMGKRALVLTGRDSERSHSLLYDLGKAGLSLSTFQIIEEPTIDVIGEGLEQARDEKRDLVIAMGGGSVIDAGKAISAMLTNPGEIMDYLEVIGEGKALTKRTAPLMAIPTTAGTGAEVTRNAVIGSTEENVKVSMRHPWLLPDVAIVDPELTLTLPKAVTASSGLDALTQLLEAFISRRSNPLTDGFCREGLARVARSLKRAYDDGDDIYARQDMSLASLLSGLALAGAGLGAVHGFAGPLGGMYSAPHGVICARLLPLVMDANVDVIKQAGADGAATLNKIIESARILTGSADADEKTIAPWLNKLCADLAVPGLSGFGLKKGDFSNLIEMALNSSSMKGAPVALDETRLKAILEKAL